MNVASAILGVSGLERDLGGAKERVYRNVRHEVEFLTLKLERTVKSEKLSGQVLNVVSGRGRRSIEHQVTATPNEIVGQVGTSLGYMVAWELGIRAHDIFPKDKKALMWPGAPHPFARVHKPAQAARPYLAPSLGGMRAEIERRLGAAGAGAI